MASLVFRAGTKQRGEGYCYYIEIAALGISHEGESDEQFSSRAEAEAALLVFRQGLARSLVKMDNDICVQVGAHLLATKEGDTE